MDCLYCEHGNPSEARFCNSCGRRIGDHLDDGKKCVSRRKRMDYDVFFNLCPHCGFAYRMGVSRSDGACADAAWTRMLLCYVSVLVPIAGFAVGGTYLRRTGATKNLGRTCVLLGILNLSAISAATLLIRSLGWG